MVPNSHSFLNNSISTNNAAQKIGQRSYCFYEVPKTNEEETEADRYF